jgi:hypothetical protein
VKTWTHQVLAWNFGNPERVPERMSVKEAGSANTWASETFGEARLGDQRRTVRLVAMAARAAESPRGTVTGVFPNCAEREGAFRLLESGDVGSEAVVAAAMAAGAKRCRGERIVYVPVDSTSLTLTDHSGRRELGRVGTRFFARGLHVMSALAVDVNGAAIGLVDQRWWARDQPPKVRRAAEQKCRRFNFFKRETRFWLDTMTVVEQRVNAESPDTIAWYQLDRGADCWPVLQLAIERNLLVTIRAVHNRRVLRDDGRVAYLDSMVRRQPKLGEYQLDIPERGQRAARRARIALRACSVTISAKITSHRRTTFRLNAVLAEEVGWHRGERVRWLLLTTHPIESFKHVLSIVRGYTMRWRIEELHRAWKRGLCNVEESQLHGRNAIIKWATVLATVAARAVRLAYLLRSSPEKPASAEFTDYEIDAAFVLMKRKRDRRKRVTLGQVIDMIAEIGGFAHKYSGRFAGPTVIGRGLDRVQVLAT